MAARITDGEYHALSELRYLIRRFLQEGDETARQAGLEPQQYLLLLAIRGLEPGQEPSIRAIAERLALRHHSTVELIDRMETHAGEGRPAPGAGFPATPGGETAGKSRRPTPCGIAVSWPRTGRVRRGATRIADN